MTDFSLATRPRVGPGSSERRYGPNNSSGNRLGPPPALSRQRFSALDLGATLYMPAYHPDSLAVANQHKWPGLNTLVFCTEDAVAESDLPKALEKLSFNLPRLKTPGLNCFVRPRSPRVLEEILKMAGVDALCGFVLPKADLESLPSWFKVLERYERFWLMPTLETKAVFDISSMARLRDELAASPFRDRILALRFGALDLLGLLELRREAERSIYESPLGQLIDQLICVFRPAGLTLTAPGYECFANPAGLADELARDVARGLFAKTALHPAQIEPIHRAYKVLPRDFEAAQALVDPEKPAVFRLNDRMCEKAVHTPWANAILRRAELYGLAHTYDEGEKHAGQVPELGQGNLEYAGQ